MKMLVVWVCILFLPVASASAGDSPPGNEGKVDCAGSPVAGNGQAAADNAGHDGFTVFPIEAPQRYKKEKNRSSEMPEDSAFAEGLRMLLGLNGSKSSDCFKKPMERGLLRNEK